MAKRIKWLCFGLATVLFCLNLSLSAAQIADLSRDGISITIDAVPETVNPAVDSYVTVRVAAPKGVRVQIPDLRDRFQGFQVAEDFAEDPVTDADGNTTCITRWRLVPLPAAEKYRLAPFVITYGTNTADDASFYTAPVLFEPPPAREPVTGGMEVTPKRDFPPLSWKLAGIIAAVIAGAAGVLALVWLVVRKIREAVRIHRMSPIERAMYELEKLLEKGLPGRGFYKDFYIELTMVVRRYIERRHGVRAPHQTTDEFLRAAENSPAFTRSAIAELKSFLESADLVKFAGVEATPEMADGATAKARNYLETDNKNSEQK